jgi:hypothetical protein
MPARKLHRDALSIALIVALGTTARAQTATVPLDAADWEGTDSVRVESYLGRPSLYINRGVALARDVTLENGAIDYDIAATPATSFLGLAFRAASPRARWLDGAGIRRYGDGTDADRPAHRGRRREPIWRVDRSVRPGCLFLEHSYHAIGADGDDGWRASAGARRDRELAALQHRRAIGFQAFVTS